MQLTLERLSQERELLKKDKEVTEHRKDLESVQLELQTVKQKMQSMEEVNFTSSKIISKSLLVVHLCCAGTQNAIDN